MIIIKVTATEPNPHVGERDSWGGPEPAEIEHVWLSGDGDSELSEIVGRVVAFMDKRGYTRFAVEEEPR